MAKGKARRAAIGRKTLVPSKTVRTQEIRGAKKTNAGKVSIGVGKGKHTLAGQVLAGVPGTSPRNYRNPRPIKNTTGAVRAKGTPGY